MRVDPASLETVLVTDCGSTTTKALLFQKTRQGWRQTSRGEAPTTVEEPVADVTAGVHNAVRELEETSERRFLIDDSHASPASLNPFIVRSAAQPEGLDLYLSTSSAGGGLQMLVAGVVRQMTAESATRAALGAGAIVLETLSADDGKEDHERIERIRHLRPDIVLLSGGIDGGARNHAIELAELLRAASPRPRFGDSLQLPVIYAGNRDAAEEVLRILAPVAQVSVVDNIRPTLEQENLQAAREAIHEFFLSHVMSHSPGYGTLLSWSPIPIMPTPAAVGDMVQVYAKESGEQILCVDIGGATTDVFSVFKNREGEQVFNRTVSANYGMSYSIANVMVEAGVAAIRRWLPFELSDNELRDRLRNKMIRPTTIPQTKEDLWLEQAVCREALRLSLEHHRTLAVGLGGVRQKRGISDIFSQKASRYDLVDLARVDLVLGSGGVLSHAPHRMQTALMMLDGFGLRGVTELAVDSIFMLPHLGVFASVHPQAAHEIFARDCLVRIAHAVAPTFSKISKGDLVARVCANGSVIAELRAGAVSLVKLPSGGTIRLRIEPETKMVDCGRGMGETFEKIITPNSFGLLLDGRNRPIEIPDGSDERIEFHRNVYHNLGL